jgi:hypothetical protein
VNEVRQLETQRIFHPLLGEREGVRASFIIELIAASQNTNRQMMTEAITATVSATNPAGTACRVRLMPTAPK